MQTFPTAVNRLRDPIQWRAFLVVACLFVMAGGPAFAQSPARRQSGPAKRHLGDLTTLDRIRDYDVRKIERIRRGRASTKSADPPKRLAEQKGPPVEAYVTDSFPGGRLSVSSDGRSRVLVGVRSPLSPPAEGDRVEIARDVLRQYRDVFSLSEREIKSLRLARENTTPGLAILSFLQAFHGVDVYGGHVKVALSGAGQVLLVEVGNLLPASGVGTRATLAPEGAVVAALNGLGQEPPGELQRLTSANERWVRFLNPLGGHYRPIELELTILPVPQASARLAYRVFVETGPLSWFEVLVDAHDGRLLVRRNLYRSAARGRVWKESPIKGSRELVTFPDGWLPESATVTTGNNVDAYLDTDGNNIPDPQPFAGTSDGRAFSDSQVFDFPAGEGSSGQDPTAFRAAAVTNLFYFVNTAHDYFYGLGFDEAAGNFQADNFGLGGLGGDAVLAEAQDPASTNNAFMAVTPEGIAPRMQMGIFLSLLDFEPTSFRDSAYAGGTVIHEYSHGVTNRIVGGPNQVGCLTGLQSAALDEGWADYFDASFFDDPVVGEYLSRNLVSGARRQSYEGYTFTYEDLGNDVFEAHDDGEVWAATLWDLRKQLGQTLTDQLVMDGLKLTPCGPSMVDARDAILLADEASNGGANRPAMWTVFARHGMGHSASGFDANFFENNVYNAAFDLPPDLEPGNRGPTILSRPTEVASLGNLYIYDVDAADPDGDLLNYELLEGPPGMTIDSGTGVIRWEAGFTGQRVKVSVTDGQGGEVIHGFSVPVLTFLTPGLPVTIGEAEGTTGFAAVAVPEGSPVLQVTLRGGSGDPDLVLVGPGDSPAASFSAGTTETISVSAPRPGFWFVLVDGFAAYSGVQLKAVLPDPTLVAGSGSVENLSGDRTSETFFRIDIPAQMSVFKVSTGGGAGDVDLYARLGRVPVCQGEVAPCEFDRRSIRPGNAERLEFIDPDPGTWFIGLNGFEAYSGVTLTTELIGPGNDPAVNVGGVVLATGTPVVNGVSRNSIITIFGQDFAPDNTVELNPGITDAGRISTELGFTCVEMNGNRLPVFAVLATQINAQASHGLIPGAASVVVIRGCGTQNEQPSAPAAVNVSEASPAFFNFINHADGRNPIAAIKEGGFVGEPGLLPGAVFLPAKPGEFVALFGTGFGETDPSFEAGQIPFIASPQTDGQALLINDLTITVAGIPVPPQDIVYAGIAPCCAGLYQLVFRIPPNVPDGDLPVTATVAGAATPQGPFITVGR